MRDYSRWVDDKPPVYGVIFPDSIGRLEFLGRLILLHGVAFLLAIPWRVATYRFPCVSHDDWRLVLISYYIYGVCLLTIWTWLQVRCCIIPRMRDVGMSPRTWWVIFIPGVNVVLALFLFCLARNAWKQRPTEPSAGVHARSSSVARVFLR